MPVHICKWVWPTTKQASTMTTIIGTRSDTPRESQNIKQIGTNRLQKPRRLFTLLRGTRPSEAEPTYLDQSGGRGGDRSILIAIAD